jgi:putative transposase
VWGKSVLLFRSLLTLLATATDRALARQVQYLKAENDILRSKLPKRLTVTAQERQRLLKFGRPLGKAIKSLSISLAYLDLQQGLR